MCLSCTLEWSSPHSRTCMCILWSCSSPFYIALSEIILSSLCLRSFTYFFFWICVWEKICDNIFPSLAFLLSPFPFIFLHPKGFIGFCLFYFFETCPHCAQLSDLELSMDISLASDSQNSIFPIECWFSRQVILYPALF